MTDSKKDIDQVPAMLAERADYVVARLPLSWYRDVMVEAMTLGIDHKQEKHDKKKAPTEQLVTMLLNTQAEAAFIFVLDSLIVENRERLPEMMSAALKRARQTGGAPLIDPRTVRALRETIQQQLDVEIQELNR